MFSKNLIEAVAMTSSQLVADMEPDDAGDACIVAEMVLDADRLFLFGYQEAHAEVKRLIAEHGFDAVMREAMKHVYTY